MVYDLITRPRMIRAMTEDMDVTPLEGDKYRVHSQSGRIYIVDVENRSCTCMDFQSRKPISCKHLYRVFLDYYSSRGKEN